MKKAKFVTIPLLVFTSIVFGQNLTQTVRGTIIDTDSESPLIGAEVIIVGSDPMIGAVTDMNGQFRLADVPIGRVALQLSYLGYESRIVPNIAVNSGKESVLNSTMQESTIKMDEIVVKVNKNKGEAINDLTSFRI